MTPEMNKNEGLPEGADQDATQRIRPGAQQNNPRRPNRKKREPFLARFEMRTSVPGMGGRGFRRKSKVEPRRA